MLRIDDLHVAYGRIRALRGISLHVGMGETVALVGPNGAGKSTTLGAICGLIKPRAGAITFDGESLVGQRPEDIVRGGVALVPERRRIFGKLTVAENLRLGLPAARLSGSNGSHVEHVLDRFPVLREMYRRDAGKLSGGQQQQLAIARALVLNPRVLLLDEPSLGLAPKLIDSVFELLADLRNEGATVLLVEQFAKRAIRFADRSYVIRTGQIVAEAARDKAHQLDLARDYLS